MSIWHWIRKRKLKFQIDEEIKNDIEPLAGNLEFNLNEILNELGHSSDIVTRRFKLGKLKTIDAALIFTDGLTNKSDVNSFLEVILTQFPEDNYEKPLTILKEQILSINEVKEIIDRNELINGILTGSTAILLDKSKVALLANTQGWETRAISEPDNQLVVRGPKQGFTEDIRTNTSLLRRIIRTSKLRVEKMRIGTLTETDVEIMYIEGLANEKIVEEVKIRLSRIKTDSIIGIGYLEDFISDNYRTLFPQLNYSERPDISAANLIEGKVLILVNGNPFVMTVPVTFTMFFQSPDDYFLRWQISSFLRLLRFFAFIISVSLPSLYVAVITYHPALLPTTLLVSLASQREGIPFPTFVEALIMEFTFDVLREAGVRLPRAIGQAISIVGALVIGTAAVEAGIVSSAMVIIVAMTGISSFTAPYIDLSNASRLIRFIWLILAGTLGLIGVLFGFMLVAIHLTSLRSFGIPYMTGIAPFNFRDHKDIFIRLPRFLMNTRPKLFDQNNPVRQDRSIPTPTKNRQRSRKEDNS